VLLAAPLDRRRLDALAGEQGEEQERLFWDPGRGRVCCERVLKLGALELSRRPWPDPPAEAVCRLLLETLREQGPDLLPWDEATRQLRWRLDYLHRRLGPPWPARGDADLTGGDLGWLAPALLGQRDFAGLAGGGLAQALWGDLPWNCRSLLDTLAPAQLLLPGGRRARLDYASGEPVLAARLQDLLGWPEGPRVLGGREPVCLHLLSPAGRPLQITRDLAGFWTGSYRQVRREMRGRYPKHAWPEDPGSHPGPAGRQRSRSPKPK
jgi:ATP-dependent helicase HrpB